MTTTQPTTEFEMVTPELARQYLLTNKINRPVNDRNYEKLVSDMKRQNFKVTGEPIQFCQNGTLLNGQHRLLAIVETGVTLSINIVRGLDPEAFKFIDTGKKRNASDVLGIEGFANPQRMAAMAVFIKNYKSGLIRDKNSLGVTNSDVLDFVKNNSEKMIESCKYGFNKENKIMKGITLSSMHFILSELNSEKANDFCWSLITGERLEKGNPIYVLRAKLIHDLASTAKLRPVIKTALIIKAWNYYIKNKEIKLLRWDSSIEEFLVPIK